MDLNTKISNLENVINEKIIELQELNDKLTKLRNIKQTTDAIDTDDDVRNEIENKLKKGKNK